MESEKKVNTGANQNNISWLNAWTDPLANLKVHSSLLGLADLNNDGDNKLVAGDFDKRLRVWKGIFTVSMNLKYNRNGSHFGTCSNGSPSCTFHLLHDG